MTRTLFTVAIALLYSAAAATLPPVTVVSPCECRDAHGKAPLGIKKRPVNSASKCHRNTSRHAFRHFQLAGTGNSSDGGKKSSA